MSNISWKLLLVSKVVLGATLLSGGAIAAETKIAPATEANPTADVQVPAQSAIGNSDAIVEPAVETLTTKSLQKADSLSVKEMPQTSVNTLAQAIPANNSPAAESNNESQILQQVNRYSQEGNQSADQVTNVSQLRDVRPGDWAYEALRSLVERYGCIAGYPDGTYRGNRAMTRYEFAAGLNACLGQIEKLIAASGGGDFASKEDLERINRLTQEFQGELATLGTRVDRLESRVGFLETHQFSTTTKLVGEAIFALTTPLRNSKTTFNNQTTENRENTVFVNRVRLDLQTSFTGRDILHTRLAAGNFNGFEFGNFNRTVGNTTIPGTSEGKQTFEIGFGPNNNSIGLDWLAYEFPYQNSKIYVAATGGLHADYAPVLNPYFYDGDGGNGALSTFAQQSPIYRIGGGAGAGIRIGLGNSGILGPTSLSLGYLAGQANSPGERQGLSNGDYGALAQLNFNLGDRLGLALTYANGYHTAGNGIFSSSGSRSGSTGLVGNLFGNLGDGSLPQAGNVVNQIQPQLGQLAGIQAQITAARNAGATDAQIANFINTTNDPQVVAARTALQSIGFNNPGQAITQLPPAAQINSFASELSKFSHSTSTFGLQAALRLSDKVSISGFVSKTSSRLLVSKELSGFANFIATGNNTPVNISADIWSYGAGIAFPDLGRRGNVLGFFAGVEPTLRGVRVGNTAVQIQRDTSYHLEGFYKYKLSDNISVTPGVIWITAPNQDRANSSEIIGTLRTTFTF